MRAHAYCDGRGNAGTGACAAVLHLPTGEVIERAERLAPTTNIVAEHKAIQLALKLAYEYKVSHLIIYNDSQTPVFQVQGLYAVKQDHLKPLVEETWRLGSLFEKVEIEWVRREKTSHPDRLCNEIDKPKAPRKKPVALSKT